MTEAAANSPSIGESENARPSLSIDQAVKLDFEEPDDEEANGEVEAEPQSTSETDETVEDGQETDEPAVEGEEPAEPEEGDEAANEAKDTVITLKSGEQVPLEELKLGYMKERDYRYKTKELGEKGRSLDDMTTRVVNTANAIAQFLADQLPAEPDYSMAMSNPNEYVRQKAVYDSALARVQQVISLGQEPQKVANERSQADSEESLAAENAKLLETFPHLAKGDTQQKATARQKFFADAFDTARELGFTDEEMQGQTDHRMFKLAHYARIGLAAEQAKSKAMTKVQNAPPAPVKAKQRPVVAADVQQSRDAMKRLSKSGSIKDALLIDFD